MDALFFSEMKVKPVLFTSLHKIRELFDLKEMFNIYSVINYIECIILEIKLTE